MEREGRRRKSRVRAETRTQAEGIRNSRRETRSRNRAAVNQRESQDQAEGHRN